MSPRWFNLEAIFWKLWPYEFFSTAHNFANGPHFVALTQRDQNVGVFLEKKVFLAKRSTFTYSMSYIFGKLWHLAIIWSIRKSFQCIPQGVRFLLAKQTWLSGTSDNESYMVIGQARFSIDAETAEDVPLFSYVSNFENQSLSRIMASSFQNCWVEQ